MAAARKMLRPEPRDLAAEIVRRASLQGHIVRLSHPPTFEERLQLLSAKLQGRPIAIMPHKCASLEEWLARYVNLTREG